MAAPVGEVMTPIVVGNVGIGFLCAGSNKPSLDNFNFNSSNFSAIIQRRLVQFVGQSAENRRVVRIN